MQLSNHSKSKKINDDGLVCANKQPLEHLPPLTPYIGPLPFRRGQVTSCTEYLKIVLMTVTLIAPLRFLLVFFGIFMSVVFFIFAYLGHTDEGLPKKGVRGWLVNMAYRCARFGLFVGGFYHVNIKAHPGSELGKARVIVSNHVSVWDGFVLLYLCHPSPVLRSDLMELPILGRSMKYIMAIPVYRGSANQQSTLKTQLIKRVHDTSAPPILIFPQGTTCNNQLMTEWMPGAFLAGAPVQAITLSYNRNKNHSVDYVEISMAGVIYRACCQFVNYVDVELLPLYKPSQKEKDDPLWYCQQVKAQVAKYRQCITTPHAFADHLLAAWGHENPMYGLDTIVCNRVYTETGLHQSCVLSVCQEFARLDKDNDGLISFFEYSQILSLTTQPDSSLRHMAEALFSFVDSDSSHFWTIPKFLVLIGAMLSDKNEMHSISLLFHLCDLNDDQTIQKKLVHDLLQALQITFTKPEETDKMDSQKENTNDYNEKYKIGKAKGLDIEHILDVMFPVSEETQVSFEGFSKALHCNFYVVKLFFVWFLKHVFLFRPKTISMLIERHQTSSNKHE